MMTSNLSDESVAGRLHLTAFPTRHASRRDSLRTGVARSMLRPRRQRSVATVIALAFGLSAIAAQAFDATGMLVAALRTAPSIDGPSIRDALARTRGYKGVTGEITMDRARNPVKPAVIMRVDPGGKFRFVASVKPVLTEQDR